MAAILCLLLIAGCCAGLGLYIWRRHQGFIAPLVLLAVGGACLAAAFDEGLYLLGLK